MASRTFMETSSDGIWNKGCGSWLRPWATGMRASETAGTSRAHGPTPAPRAMRGQAQSALVHREMNLPGRCAGARHDVGHGLAVVLVAREVAFEVVVEAIDPLGPATPSWRPSATP